jgi:hypothetical protein
MDEIITALVKNPWPFIIGFFVAELPGCPCFGVKQILNWVSKEIDDEPQDGIGSKEWKKMITPVSKNGPKLLGWLERILFYIAIVSSYPQLILGWLAFKVASKWEILQNMVKVPGVKATDSKLGIAGRRAWGDRVLQRFLIGTLVNILAGFLGALTTAILLKIWA